ncbi:MAG: GTPase domain-containing protein [Verrucomicrobiales bacterium]|nr:GTPase domain-containing protein [Verrucomicrobiales bacterium]
MSEAVTLSLISHTNVGKTTLARTLLKRDVGEAFDQPHVTDANEGYTLIERGGEELRLWDTPGFGDSARLLKRLRENDRPFAWVLTQVWDRIGDRALWCSQQAMKNVKEEADVVLYLANASEDPRAVGYVGMEMEILEWTGKPVIVLLNQTGGGTSGDGEGEDEARWADFFKGTPVVRAVLGLDAFSRCWVQEGELMDVLVNVLVGEIKGRCERLRDAWEAENRRVFDSAVAVLGRQVKEALDDSVEVAKETLVQKLGIGRHSRSAELAGARDVLAGRLGGRAREGLNQLIRLYGLEGESARAMERLSAESFEVPKEVNESVWSAVGGVTTGALAGLVVDLKTAGLSFGSGAVAGGVVGGVSAFGLAKGYNLARARDSRVRWSLAHLKSQVELILLSYLAVAHHGRGRGAWQDGEFPAVWGGVAGEEIERHSSRLESWWKDPAGCGEAEAARWMGGLTADVLRRLYPEWRG